jgi:hypothetical protein
MIARVVVCATGAVHTDIFRSIRSIPLDKIDSDIFAFPASTEEKGSGASRWGVTRGPGLPNPFGLIALNSPSAVRRGR